MERPCESIARFLQGRTAVLPCKGLPMTLHHPSLKDMMNDVVAAGSCCEAG
ncbi:MAG: hypothetical protein HYT99_01295 [Candidatus Tectomicrobia bacterium]|nr:hypothetical protein [Candidatus Tectomicrobia bacterium]